jgi:CheY-like chemotaxis protein
VDDEEIIIDVCGEILKELGYDVIVTTSGKQAVDIYREQWQTIDLVILDMVMPEMGGIEVFNTLRKIHSNTRILISSGFSLEDQAEEMMNLDCDGFIQKPFNIMELSEKIGRLIDAK